MVLWLIIVNIIIISFLLMGVYKNSNLEYQNILMILTLLCKNSPASLSRG